MTKLTIAALIFAAFPLLAQAPDAPSKFFGTWEAKVDSTVVCTIRLKAGDPISGATEACSIHADSNGNLLLPDSNTRSDQPASIINARLNGDTLNFEEKDDDGVTKFELTLTGDGKADLKLPEAPVLIKPIHFARK